MHEFLKDGWHIERTREKTYLHDDKAICRARLCKISAEFWTLDGCYSSLNDCSFEVFKEAVKKLFGIDVADKYRPDWAKGKVDASV